MTTVELPGPLDVAGSVEIFRRSGDDLLDRWDGTRLIRTLRVGQRTVAYLCTLADSIERPAVELTVEDPADLDAVAAAVRASFVPAPPSWRDLLARDPVLARLDARFPGLRPVRQLDLFGALLRCISAQQVNLRWAATTRRRLAEAYGERHQVDGHSVRTIDPARIAALPAAAVRALQFTTHKSVSIVAVARAIADGQLALAELARLSDDAVIARLVALRGLGRWSAEWVLARTLGRPRVVAGDLGVRKAVGLAYRLGEVPSEAEVRAATAHWAGSAGVAQAVLLHALGEGWLTSPTPRGSRPAPA
jgi:DNA-3-methyladenine glycosylase II